MLVAAVTKKSFYFALSQTLPKEIILKANIINITVSERLSCKNGLSSLLKIYKVIKYTTGNRKHCYKPFVNAHSSSPGIAHEYIALHILLSYLWVAATDVRLFMCKIYL